MQTIAIVHYHLSMRPERPRDEPPDLIVVGEAMVDVRAPAVRPGQRSHGSISLRAGGTAVNAALAAASIGARVCVVGRVGDDGAGRLVRDALEAAGVECASSWTRSLPTGTFVEVGDSIVADPGASAALTIDDIPRPLRASAVLLSPYFRTSWPARSPRLRRRAGSRDRTGTSTSATTHPRPATRSSARRSGKTAPSPCAAPRGSSVLLRRRWQGRRRVPATHSPPAFWSSSREAMLGACLSWAARLATRPRRTGSGPRPASRSTMRVRGR